MLVGVPLVSYRPPRSSVGVLDRIARRFRNVFGGRRCSWRSKKLECNWLFLDAHSVSPACIIGDETGPASLAAHGADHWPPRRAVRGSLERLQFASTFFQVDGELLPVAGVSTALPSIDDGSD